MAMRYGSRGSALLVVLGMLAFMVISSVAFSAYMRYSRLPSSFLRQTVASRLLVKAALAEAIDEVDAAIGNNPHPGVGTQEYYFPRETDESGGVLAKKLNRNKWIGRVYIGCTNSSQSTESPSRSMVGQNETVSPLCLEALAYIPPPLVNEARYYSRRSQAAKWKSLPYDAGRYAFCAIDVSDYFDVNAVHADIARSSAAESRVSIAHLFENDDHTALSGSQGTPKGWDDFMSQYRGDELPLVSMADWNLAVNDRGPSGWFSPFCRYVEGGGANNFYNNVTPASTEGEAIRRMVFVTDSWMTNTNQANQAGDLATMQPFNSINKGDSDGSQPSVNEILADVSETGVMIEKGMTGLDVISLWDYLDKNDVPASLALPTVERVPMLVGMEPNISIQVTPKVEMAVSSTYADHDGVETIHENRLYKYSISIDSPGSIIAGAWMFPFLRGKGYPGGFTPEFAVRLGFVNTSSGLPTGNRVNNSSRGCGFVVSDKNDFTAQDGSVANGVFKLSKTASLNFTSSIKKESDALVSPAPATLNVQALNSWATGPNGVLFTVEREVFEKKNTMSGAWDAQPGYPKVVNTTVNSDVYPLEKDLISKSALETDLKSATPAGIPTKLFIAITARVTKGGSATVDLVPASYVDDNKYNAINQDANVGNLNGGENNYPLMLFGDATANNVLNFQETAFGYTPSMSPGSASGQPVTFNIVPPGGTSVFCPDPRWNFAPENFMVTQMHMSDVVNAYLDGDNKAQMGLGSAGCDGDIFMAVSNRKWMQSPSELAFLSRTSTDIGGGDPVLGDAKSLLTAKTGQGFATQFGDLAHASLMWKTYRLYDMNGFGRDDIYGVGLYDSTPGFKVSPYSNCTNVFMAAFANTPYSWWAAGIGNENCDITDVAASDAEVNTFNRKYAFNGFNDDAKFDWEDLARVGGSIMDRMRNSGLGWQQAFDNMDWAGLNSDFCGINFSGETEDLHEVDRKMLFGFWRDCFDAKQQLFLIFVRAEPMMMGGGSANQTPPQLGAKAMALVWRDPRATTNGGNNPPHKTRVLFYRQFD